MKNMNRMIGLLRTSALCLTLAVMAACDAEDFTRTAGDIPDKNDLTNVGGVLRREKTPEQISMIKIQEGLPAIDAIFYQLTQPVAEEVKITVEVDETLVDGYNKKQMFPLKLFPLDEVFFKTGKTLTITKGAKISDRLNITLSRERVIPGMYILPVRASVGSNSLKPSDKDQVVYYQVAVPTPVPESELNVWPFKVVGYVNTEEMNPMIAAQFTMTTFDFLNPDESQQVTERTWVDFVPLRKATIKANPTSRQAKLELGSDLQYVLNNRDKYLLPLQKSGRKVFLCIQGGNTGLGFCNMRDEQISEFVYQIKYVVENYDLDGVNFFDMEAGYDKDGAAALIPASYPKLIKVTKEALGDKLVTIACDKESNDILTVAQNGIEAGRYIDYAWSGVFDKVIDAYADNAELKPVAGLSQTKYGGMFLQIHTDSWATQNKPILKPLLTSLYRKTQSANIFTFYDLPTNKVGTEQGPGNTFRIISEAITDENFEYDGVLYDINMSPAMSGTGYGNFKKDW